MLEEEFVLKEEDLDTASFAFTEEQRKENLKNEVINTIMSICNSLNLQFSNIGISDIKLMDVADFEEEYVSYKTYYILDFYGGLNGGGKFLFYLQDVEVLVKALMCFFDRVWLINWSNDCADDVFDLQIGVANNNE